MTYLILIDVVECGMRPRSVPLLLLVTSFLVIPFAPSAAAVNQVSIGRLYDDGLDTRLAASRVTSAAAATGYAATAHTAGRDETDAWVDGVGSGVMALFGHGNAGIFQTDEGATSAEDPILAAGLDTDIVNPYAGFRFFSEYLPYVDVDDMRLLIVAGCYTARSDPRFGSFNDIPVRRGVDAVVTFSDLVYFPSSTPGRPVSETDYSGNYFWSRFAYHSQLGNSVSVALSRARTDLVTKEGDAGGWDRYQVHGSVANPGAVRLSPAGSGELLGTDPVPATPFTTVSSLTPVHAQTQGDGAGGLLTAVTTAEGISYRTDGAGHLIDLVAQPTLHGAIALSEADALTVARRFITANGLTAPPDAVPTTARVSHGPGDALVLIDYRTTDAGLAGPARLSLEVDLRSGAVVYLATAHGAARESGVTTPVLTRQAAEEIALTALPYADPVVHSVTAEVWDRATWTVEVSDPSTADAPFPVRRRISVDGATGEVVAHSST
jgi:hypothetical protein